MLKPAGEDIGGLFWGERGCSLQRSDQQHELPVLLLMPKYVTARIQLRRVFDFANAVRARAL